MWFQVRGEFETDGGEARDGSRGRRVSEEKVGSGVQIFLVAGGWTVSWTEVTRLGEGTIVEMVCRLKGQVKPEGKEASHKPEKTRAKVRGRIDQRQRSGDQREQQRGDDLDVGRNRRQSQAH